MKFHFTFTILITFNLLSAQTTITKSQFPKANDSLKSYLEVLSSPRPDLRNIGVNKTWIISSISTSKMNLSNCQLPSGFGQKDSFPGSNVVLTENSREDQYYRHGASGFELLGYWRRSGSHYVKYTTPFLEYPTPFSYGDQKGKIDFRSENRQTSGSLNVVSKGSVYFKGTGQGTLILLGDTFNDVLQIERLEQSYDSAASGGAIINRHFDTSYFYFHKNYSNWLAVYSSFETIDLIGMSTKNNTLSVRIPSSLKPSSIKLNIAKTLDPEILVFPNPSNGQNTYVQYANLKIIRVFNIEGQEVFYKNLLYASGIEALPRLQQGIYILKGFINGDKIISKKIIVY